jgi:nucleotide-binding universal stress UspA family protein
MMKRILFPTDFSAAADNAFLFALAIAKKFNSELTLLHVYELPELGRALKSTTKEVYEMMEMEALRDFKTSVKKLHEIADENGFGDVAFSQEMAEGETVFTITKIAEKEKFDLIVMGTQGATGLKEVFLGSVATGVIDESSAPVLTIPSSASHQHTISKVAYLSNYKEEELAAFQLSADFASAFDAELMCIHYKTEKEDNEKDVAEWRKKTEHIHGNTSYHVITGDDFEKALIELNTAENINVLAVQPRRKNIFARLFSKSVSKSIAHHIEVPLLALPKK